MDIKTFCKRFMLWAAGLIALCAGIGKELWDKYHGGVPSWGDIAWDAAGVLVGVGLVLLKHIMVC